MTNEFGSQLDRNQTHRKCLQVFSITQKRFSYFPCGRGIKLNICIYRYNCFCHIYERRRVRSKENHDESPNPNWDKAQHAPQTEIRIHR
ncbi:hypothetical protein VNO77_32843 [Canavalia gladiata]|uniref:Uncharacterized protein n=1 Tax=Canavalia gladiata TaxID=3824 RepID=A0AAN9KCB1_CANGL